MTSYESTVAAMARYRQAGLTPERCPETWERLWQDVARAYLAGCLSDSEYDDLRGRF